MAPHFVRLQRAYKDLRVTECTVCVDDDDDDDDEVMLTVLRCQLTY